MGRGPAPEAAARPAPRPPPRRRGPLAAAPMRCCRSSDPVVARAVDASGRLTSPLPTPLADPIGRMESPESAGRGEIVKEVKVPQAALSVPAHETGDTCHTPVTEGEEVGIPIPAPGFLQVTERRQPLSSVSSLEVHFDLLDLTELTDMSDQELAEVFADSDDENLATESPAGLHPLSRAGCLRSPSWTKTRAEQNREKQPPSDPERQGTAVDTFLTVEGPKED
ncbi:LOW QUALITY PROTEIN: dysbindin domain-containing protein 1 [Alexandromys fortis]|uniref:LOW QUALITY PROTEIN: dysbindin domain-containing protein 1 n=1 Tax=Alexandromys fortis TaxID=100897 RepID=UPI0021520717|nr:LOW QUALITY PROTEIN: dysbindin domain-containing protein 1 [Microtus fortis]